MILTAAILQAAIGCSTGPAVLYAPLLQDACDTWAINTPARMAAFLAQVGHESGSLQHSVEIWGPTTAQTRYENREDLGNFQPGDGHRFRGRGLIQVTGRYNYREITQRMRRRMPGVPDFEATPDALAEPRWAAASAACFWDWKSLNAYADVEPPADIAAFTEITRKINGGVNGLQDRRARWERALRVLMPPAAPEPVPPTEEPIAPPRTEARVPIPAIIGAVLPSIIEAIPKLGKIFGSGSAVSERNNKAAEVVVDIVRHATGATNAQDAAEKITVDPNARQAAEDAVTARWLEITESGGGGIEGAGRRDAAARASGDSIWRSPSLIIALVLLPLVYLIVLSLIGLIGTATWSDDVRAGLAGAMTGSIVGGLVGYYYGQTTSRNRSGPPPASV